MKRTLTLVVALTLIATMLLGLVSCDGNETTVAQGIDTENHIIHVGNTAATTGSMASVGEPFNYGQEAYFWYYNTLYADAYKDADGNKYTIQFTHYDDGFDGTKGKTFTKKLVEEDKVFALVGHFGTNTVGATMDYLEEIGIPMVYGVTGASDLYDTERNVMTVQPIYDTEGQHMVATAFAPVEAGGLGAKKLGVISTTDDAGKGMLAGIKAEVEKLGKGSLVTYTSAAANAANYTAEVTALKEAGCDVVIIAANQYGFPNIATTFVTVGYDNVKILTSYVSANPTLMGGLILGGVMTETREVYGNAWLHSGAMPDTSYKGWNDYVEFVRVLSLYDQAMGNTLFQLDDPTVGALLQIYFGDQEWAKDGISAMYLESYVMAGYVSANVFCQGLTRMSGQTLTWEGFIDAMESAPINVPMGKDINYANGKRVGIDTLAVNCYNNSAFGELYRGMTDIKKLEESIK